MTFNLSLNAFILYAKRVVMPLQAITLFMTTQEKIRLLTSKTMALHEADPEKADWLLEVCTDPKSFDLELVFKLVYKDLRMTAWGYDKKQLDNFSTEDLDKSTILAYLAYDRAKEKIMKSLTDSSQALK